MVTVSGLSGNAGCSGLNGNTLTITSVPTNTTFHYTDSGGTISSCTVTGATAEDNTAGTQPTFSWALAVTAVSTSNTSSGYTAPPTVTVTPNGSTLAGSFSVTAYLGLSVTAPAGRDYTGLPPTATVAAPTLAPTTQAATVTGGKSIAITAPDGSGYTTAPTVGFAGEEPAQPRLRVRHLR